MIKPYDRKVLFSNLIGDDFLSDYIPWEFEENSCFEPSFEELKEKYKTHRAQILPQEQWGPLVDEWLKEHFDPDSWFILHVTPCANADLYRAALKQKGFAFKEINNKNCDTPIYLETPVAGLNVDQTSLIETVRDMENREGVLYYRNIPAPIVDLLYKEVFEERLVYPERFN